MSIAKFFQKFGIESHHQRMDPSAGNMTPYNFRNPPPWAASHIKKKSANIKKQTVAFESSWGMAHYFYAMSLEFPDAEFLIMLRDPVCACNSLRALNHNQHRKGLDELALLYNMTMLSLIWQSQLMERKPRWLDFNKYVTNEYRRGLFRLFDIEDSADNRLIARKHLQTKINSSGHYNYQSCPYFADGRMFVSSLKRSLEEL
jgi:hypothetical protein